MKIMILEDDPMIAMDMEDMVSSHVDAEIILAASLIEARRAINGGVDFALLDITLDRSSETSLPIAAVLQSLGVPFCFVSGDLNHLPQHLAQVPAVAKPYRPQEIAAILPA